MHCIHHRWVHVVFENSDWKLNIKSREHLETYFCILFYFKIHLLNKTCLEKSSCLTLPWWCSLHLLVDTSISFFLKCYIVSVSFYITAGVCNCQWERASRGKTAGSTWQQCVGISEKSTTWLELRATGVDQPETGFSAGQSTGSQREHRHLVGIRQCRQMCHILRMAESWRVLQWCLPVRVQWDDCSRC